jgi:predicted esterase
MPAAAPASNISRLKIMPAPAATAPRRPLRPRMFGRVKVSAGEQQILATFVARVNRVADSAECRLQYGSDRQARIVFGFSQGAQKESEMRVVLALMLSLPELPVPVVFQVLESWSGA